LSTIKLFNGLLTLPIVLHGYEGEASGTPRFAIHDDRNIFDGSILTKRITQRLLSRRVGDVSDIQFHNKLHASELCLVLNSHAETTGEPNPLALCITPGKL
jgi:hypothetical protein